MQQLPLQHGGELRHLHDEPCGRQREPLRRLPQRILYGRGHQGRKEPHHIAGTWRRTAGTASPAMPAPPQASPAGRAAPMSTSRPTRTARPVTTARPRPDYHAAARSGDRHPVQQLPHQHRRELYHLYDEPRGGQRQPLRRLPQRLVYGRRHQGRARHRVVSGPCRDRRPGLHHLPRQRGSFTSWAGGTYVHQASDTNCSSCHNGTTAPGMTTPPHIPVPASSAATATPTRRRASSPTR